AVCSRRTPFCYRSCFKNFPDEEGTETFGSGDGVDVGEPQRRTFLRLATECRMLLMPPLRLLSDEPRNRLFEMAAGRLVRREIRIAPVPDRSYLTPLAKTTCVAFGVEICSVQR